MEFKEIFEWQKNVIDGTHIKLDEKLFNMPLRIGIVEYLIIKTDCKVIVTLQSKED